MSFKSNEQPSANNRNYLTKCQNERNEKHFKMINVQKVETKKTKQNGGKITMSFEVIILKHF